jgi:DNA helicase IV
MKSSDNPKSKENILRSIIQHWIGWDEHENYYLKELVPQLIKNPNSGDSFEREAFKILNKILTSREKENLSNIIKETKVKLAQKVVEEKQRKKDEEEKAKRIKLHEEEIMSELTKMLKSYNFLEADRKFLDEKDALNEVLPQENYEEIKGLYVQSFFEKTFNNLLPPDDEQSNAIAALGNKVLVSARAGSGKTQTISSKVTLLTEKYNIKPEQILVLCFNANAAEEMQTRIRKNQPNFNNARTFHSWAWSIVQPGNSILFDSGGQFSPKEFSKFIKSLINEILYKDKNFAKEIYKFFREESEYLSSSLSETKEFLNDTDRYMFLRNQTEISLNGTRTKSSGEKWIADFLFEHGIDFFYERHLTWYLKDQDDRPYHPDFTFEYRGRHYVLEHWGIDEYDFRKKVPEHWHKTWDEYHIEMNRKRDYFSTNRKYKLLETSIRDIKYSLPIPERRRDFENKFKKKLESHGIYCQKLSTEQLIAKAWKKNMFNLLHELSGQFIGWIEKLELSEQDIINILERGGYNDRQKKFCKIGMKIYKMYLEKLDEKKKIDFNLLVSSATQKIKNGEFDVSHLKYILIDEFQDFSQLFQNLIDATTKANPEINLFCVGDPWQLINGFAGSDPDLFYNFSDIANNKTISTCYRSTKEIVENANKFANKHSVFIGTRGEFNNTKNETGFVISKIIDSVEIINDNKDEGKGFMEDNQFKKYFRKERLDGQGSFMPDNQYINAGYLKYATEIVQDNPDSSFLFLYRNKDMHGMAIYEDFQGYLKASLRDEEITYKNIEFCTAHSSKGREADIVVILNLVEGTFPSIHPSNQFFEIFGLTPSRVLDEEKRLFYVGITRAKKGLYVISEAGKVSDFFDPEYIEDTKRTFDSDLPF